MRLETLLQRWTDEEDGGPVAVALHRDIWNPEVTAHFTIDGEPQSKARARVTFKSGKATAYTPRQTQAAEETVAWTFRQAGGRGPDGAKTFGVFAVFFCGTRQRRDVDNMLKLLLDGLNKVAWVDDSQVTEVSARLVRGVPTEDARSEVIVYETNALQAGGLTETKPCEQCRKPIRIYPSTSHTRFCSNACAGAAKRMYPDVPCLHCGEMFMPRGGGLNRRFCSAECSKAARTVTRDCRHCGATLTSPQSWNRKFCGPQCHGAWRRGKPREARA